MKRSDRVTIVDVARAAGTSVSSASVALRGEPGVSERTRATSRASPIGWATSRTSGPGCCASTSHGCSG